MENNNVAVIPQLMNLAFFANRFGVQQQKLKWSILQTVSDEDVFYTPIVAIAGTSVFINIKQDTLGSAKSVFGREIKIIPAKLEETADNYIFKSPYAEVKLDKQELQEFYACKFLWPENLK